VYLKLASPASIDFENGRQSAPIDVITEASGGGAERQLNQKVYRERE
jgi:hypothetical protein